MVPVRRYEIFDFDLEIFKATHPTATKRYCNITEESRFLKETGILGFYV
jgi:hypothetical protein